QLTLSYCCSIHKSQGSEFPIVIMPVVRSQRKMLKRNLLYTGITRAQKFLILCGEPEEFKAGIARTDELSRQTTLQERLGTENELNEGIETETHTNSKSQSQTASPSSNENTIDSAEDKEPGIYKLTM
ncbi:ATP-binding domain-containing protein, partial [Microvirga sp. 3-52]|nr:ATP-binding domain-containing protein [Microvirga sp. 3-52]